MIVSTVTLSQDQINDITNYINTYRIKHHANVLTYNLDISNISQSWATYLSFNNLFKHSNNKQYGENLAWFGGYKNDIVNLIKKSIDSWYNEIQYYNFSNPGFSSDTGHFSQLVWAGTNSFGIGYSYNNSNHSAIIVFNFSPPGNIIGLFSQNVLPI